MNESGIFYIEPTVNEKLNHGQGPKVSVLVPVSSFQIGDRKRERERERNRNREREIHFVPWPVSA